ncbi:MAG: MerR family transcriptional regulator [Thermodesulfovibrionales bacterium]
MKRDKDQPVYMISVVSRMLKVHPQTLRLYEREGLVSPRRARGQRLYSEADLERLGFIVKLTRDMGVNRAGVDIILRMRHRLEGLQREVEGMMQLLDEEMREDFEEKIRRIFLEEEED